MHRPIHQTTDRPHPTTGAIPAFGYASAHYAASLAEFGEPLELPACGGWLLKRPIQGTKAYDAMGCYPLFACQDWAGLGSDLAALKGRLVSATLVTDPFGMFSEKMLRRTFPDLCTKFKDHYVVDLDRISMETLSAHHRRNVRRGLREVTTDFCAEPARHLDEWCRLYRHLIERHGVKGIAAFSRSAFRRQMDVPGLLLQRAVRDRETVGMVLWMLSGGVAYYHLGAYSDHGYRLRASYALFWHALEYFRGRAQWAALGAAAGTGADQATGLDRFKAGWTTDTRPAFLCGRILLPNEYAELCRKSTSPGAEGTDYFPAYRAGEFR